MKKQYIRYGAIFCIVVLLAFSIAFIIFTKNKIDDYNLYFNMPFISANIDYHADNDDGQLEQQVIRSWDRYLTYEYADRTGFYSSITDVNSGKVILDSFEQGIHRGDAEIEKLNDLARKAGIEGEKTYKPYSGVTTKKGIFTSTSVLISQAGEGSIHVSYCIAGKPLSSVLKINAMTYVFMFLGFVILEILVVVSFVMLYKNQMNYEIRNQKLTRGIAHELKTPLAVTKATVENWEYFDDDRRKDYSKRIINEVDHMSDMVGKLLDVSKIKEGSEKLNREAVDLKKLTEDMIGRNSELIRERNITLAFNRDEKPYTVFADPEMMNMVISNFMSNAIKYCDHIITIRLIRNGRKIEFGITNDGAKIEKDELDKVWDIFYTTDKARTDRMSSSGVGLSVVKSILDAHEADYGCTSGDKGTEFKFSMPAYEKAR
ncbi:MAG: HAMP domain-containing histidine kinase [Clostridiales bacterium]|nr:HAMP domain-containing histidine kinase [Clostridiales bacterium]